MAATIDCSKITEGLVAANCGTIAVSGTEKRVILVNYTDIDRSLSIVSPENIITDLVLIASAKGYEYLSFEGSTHGEATLNKGTYVRNWQHNLTLRIFAKNQLSKDFVDDLKDSRVVAIVENRESGLLGDIKYEAYGWDAGLKLNECTSTTDMADNVVYTCKLGNTDISKEGSLPKSVFNTDLVSTKTMLDGLVA